MYFCIVYAHASAGEGSDTTYWKSDTGRFVFGDLNYHYQISIKGNAEVTPTGVYIRSRSVPRANYALNGTLLGASCIYSSVGIYSVRSIGMAVVGQSYSTSRCRYPVFRLCGSDDRVTNHSGTWVSAGEKERLING